jgi:hypothetical protein
MWQDSNSSLEAVSGGKLSTCRKIRNTGNRRSVFLLYGVGNCLKGPSFLTTVQLENTAH